LKQRPKPVETNGETDQTVNSSPLYRVYWVMWS